MIQIMNKSFINNNNKKESPLQIIKKKSDNQPIEKWGRDNARNFLMD